MDELILYKVAALFHDPPYKAWTVLHKIRLLTRREEGEKTKAHESEAMALAKAILEGTSLERAAQLLNSDIVSRADKMAAGQDRNLIGAIGEKFGTTDLKNIFKPEFRYPVRELPSISEIQEFVRRLNSILKACPDNKKYHVLYSVLEPLCNEIKSIGPADTRVPHHTIFDHLCATAAMVNWTYGSSSYSGFLALIDLAGIGSFISSARKLSDYWAGSWLVSAMAWNLAREFVEEYGPDVLIIPTSRSNPFYLFWLVRSKDLPDHVKREIVELLKLEELGVSLDERKWPKQPVVPGTMVLALPLIEDLRERIAERYLRSWRELVEVVAEEASGKLCGSTALSERLRSAIEIIKEVPPLTLRIRLIEVGNEMRSLTEIKGKIQEEIDKIDNKDEKAKMKDFLEKFDVEKALLYHHLMNRLFRGRINDYVSVDPSSAVDWTNLTSSGRYRMCTICGRLPAIVRRPNADKIEVLTPEGYKGIKVGNESRINRLIKEREGLCPYCLIKRFLPEKKVIGQALRIFLGVEVDEVRRPRFPSNGDIASLGAKIKILREVSKRKLEKALVDKMIEEHILIRDYLISTSREEVEILPKMLADEYHNLAKDLPEDRKDVLKFLAVEEADDLLLSSEKGAKFLKILRELGIRVNPLKYYAILKADGDFMGDILAGVLPEFDSLEEYYRELFSGMENISQDFLDRTASKLSKFISLVVRAYYKQIFPRWTDERPRIIVSPSYHFAVSRSLMATSRKDVELIEKLGGVVIYAGGDDLAALLPMKIEEKGCCVPLEAVIETRASYWGMNRHPHGFHMLGSIISAAVGAGRSYSIKVAHYRDPMKGEIGLADQGEHLAKNTSTSEGVKKDSTCVIYGKTLCNECFGIVPNRTSRKAKEISIHSAIQDIWNYVERGIASTSLLYDFMSQLSFIEEAKKTHQDTAEKVVENLFKRNFSNEQRAREAFKSIARTTNCSITVDQPDRREVWCLIEAMRVLRLLRGGVRS